MKNLTILAILAFILSLSSIVYAQGNYEKGDFAPDTMTTTSYYYPDTLGFNTQQNDGGRTYKFVNYKFIIVADSLADSCYAQVEAYSNNSDWYPVTAKTKIAAEDTAYFLGYTDILYDKIRVKITECASGEIFKAIGILYKP